MMFSADISHSQLQFWEGSGEQRNTQADNLDYLFPKFSQPSPWQHKSTAEKGTLLEDFILIAEFSEQEGPRPVIVIPKDGGGDFDQNEFSVKILAVDHQSSIVEGSNMTEDAQVVMSDTDKNAHAFIHHIVLNDIQARGYVRPFCISYVTADPQKIMKCYETISTQLRKVAKMMKYGNRLVFLRDLEKYLEDLDYTKAHLLISQRSMMSSAANDNDVLSALNTIRQSMEEVKDIMSKIRNMLNDSELQDKFQAFEQRLKINTQESVDSCGDRSSLKDFPVSPSESAMETSGSYTDKLNPEFSLFGKNKDLKPKLLDVSTLKGKRRFDRSLRGLHELCSWGAREGLRKLRSIREYLMRDYPGIYLDELDEKISSPDSSLLSFGYNTVGANFLTCYSSRDAMFSKRKSCSSHPRLYQHSLGSVDSFKSLPSSYYSILDEEMLYSAQSSTIESSSQLSAFDRQTSITDSFETKDSGEDGEDWMFNQDGDSESVHKYSTSVIHSSFMDTIKYEDIPGTYRKRTERCSDSDFDVIDKDRDLTCSVPDCRCNQGAFKTEGKTAGGNSVPNGIRTFTDKSRNLRDESSDQIDKKCDNQALANDAYAENVPRGNYGRDRIRTVTDESSDIDDDQLDHFDIKGSNQTVGGDTFDETYAANIPRGSCVRDRIRTVTDESSEIDGDHMDQFDIKGSNQAMADDTFDDANAEITPRGNMEPKLPNTLTKNIGNLGLNQQREKLDGVDDMTKAEVTKVTDTAEDSIMNNSTTTLCDSNELTVIKPADENSVVCDNNHETKHDTIPAESELSEDMHSNNAMGPSHTSRLSNQIRDNNIGNKQGLPNDFSRVRTNLTSNQSKVDDKRIEFEDSNLDLTDGAGFFIETGSLRSDTDSQESQTEKLSLERDSLKKRNENTFDVGGHSLNYARRKEKLFLPFINRLEADKTCVQCLQKVFCSYNNLQHVVYSLLSGRPVVLVCTRRTEDLMRELLYALTIFTPIVPSMNVSSFLCQIKQLRISEIHKVQLRGIIRSEKRPIDYLIPQSVRRFITLIDVDKMQLYAQPYQGKLLNFIIAIHNKKRTFKSDQALHCYVQMWLMEISSKAFNFYHCISESDADTDFYDVCVPRKSAMLELSSDKHLNKSGLLNSDCRIIKNLAELVKVQQIEDEFKCKYLTDSPVYPFSISYLPTYTYKLQ